MRGDKKAKERSRNLSDLRAVLVLLLLWLSKSDKINVGNDFLKPINRDPYWFFLQVISRWHTCLGKTLLACSIGKNGNRTACKWKGYVFIIFTWPVEIPVHLDCSVTVDGHRKSRYKWKWRPLWLSWRQKGMLSLFLLVFGFLSFIDQACSVNMAGFWPLFLRVYGPRLRLGP